MPSNAILALADVRLGVDPDPRPKGRIDE